MSLTHVVLDMRPRRGEVVMRIISSNPLECLETTIRASGEDLDAKVVRYLPVAEYPGDSIIVWADPFAISRGLVRAIERHGWPVEDIKRRVLPGSEDT